MWAFPTSYNYYQRQRVPHHISCLLYMTSAMQSHSKHCYGMYGDMLLMHWDSSIILQIFVSKFTEKVVTINTVRQNLWTNSGNLLNTPWIIFISSICTWRCTDRINIVNVGSTYIYSGTCELRTLQIKNTKKKSLCTMYVYLYFHVNNK